LLTRHKLTNQNITLLRKLDRELPLVQGDATQLEQAFLNLTLNAIEAMPGGGKLTISSRVLRLPKEGGAAAHVAVLFRDTGQGMTPEQEQGAFTSLLNTTKPKGTGLGLAIVRRIVESHGGDVHVRSRPGRGTTITVLLPVAPLQETDNGGTTATP
jgi:signal transduction histidine kinase